MNDEGFKAPEIEIDLPSTDRMCPIDPAEASQCDSCQ